MITGSLLESNVRRIDGFVRSKMKRVLSHSTQKVCLRCLVHIIPLLVGHRDSTLKSRYTRLARGSTTLL